MAASSRAEDNLEVGLAFVADGISRRAVGGLVRVGPALGESAVARRADLAGALVVGLAVDGRVNCEADILLGALHEGKVVSSAILAGVLGVAELEESLVLPLAGGAPLGVAGDAHANGLEVGGDGLGSVAGNADGAHLLEHLEVASDLVHAKVLLGGALVADLDVEGIGAGAALNEPVDGRGCCRQGEQRAEEPACGVHFGGSECGGTVKWWRKIVWRLPFAVQRCLKSDDAQKRVTKTRKRVYLGLWIKAESILAGRQRDDSSYKAGGANSRRRETACEPRVAFCKEQTSGT